MAVQGEFVLQMEVFPRLKAFVNHWIAPLSAVFLSRGSPGTAAEHQQRAKVRDSPDVPKQCPAPPGAGRAARLETRLGPGNHIPGGAAEGPQLGTAALQRPRPEQRLLPEHQGPQPG